MHCSTVLEPLQDKQTDAEGSVCIEAWLHGPCCVGAYTLHCRHCNVALSKSCSCWQRSQHVEHSHPIPCHTVVKPARNASGGVSAPCCHHASRSSETTCITLEHRQHITKNLQRTTLLSASCLRCIPAAAQQHNTAGLSPRAPQQSGGKHTSHCRNCSKTHDDTKTHMMAPKKPLSEKNTLSPTPNKEYQRSQPRL